MRSISSVEAERSLDEVRREFDRWRARRCGRGQTPPELRHRAASLLKEHRAFHICRALGINATALKRWTAEQHEPGLVANEPPWFVALEMSESSPTPTSQDKPSDSASALVLELPGCIRVHCDSVTCASELLAALGVCRVPAFSS